MKARDVSVLVLAMVTACLALVAIQQGRAGALAQSGPPIEYIKAAGKQHVPQGMHLEYVAANSLAGNAPPRIAAEAGHWTYIPDEVLAHGLHSSAHRDAHTTLVGTSTKHKLTSLDDEEGSEEGGEEGIAEDPSLAVNEADETASVDLPFSGERACGITSLREQAHAIFPRWDSCGYMMADKVGQPGFIAPPQDDIECTASMMTKPPCNTATLRQIKSHSLEGLKACMTKIKGLSQTCNAFDKCGPVASSGPFQGRRSSVCFAPEGDYYKEPSVQRMCGICGMFRAQDGLVTATVEDTRVASTWLGSALKAIQHLF